MTKFIVTTDVEEIEFDSAFKAAKYIYRTMRNDVMKVFETHQLKVRESAINHIITLLNTGETLSFGEPEEQCRMDFY